MDKDIDEIIKEHNLEIENTLKELKDKIDSGDADSETYHLYVDYLEMADKKDEAKAIRGDYMKKTYSLAIQELKSSESREKGYCSLAEYYKYLKDYKKALECYDNAVALNPECLNQRALFRVEYMNDRKGALKDYELMKQAGLPQEAFQFYDLVVRTKKTKNETFLVTLGWILIILLGIGFFAFIYMM